MKFQGLNPSKANKLLCIALRILFKNLAARKSEKILIYHVGNIGDIIVATPIYRSIRKSFPETRITLLTSPGKRGLPGAQEIVAPFNLFDDIKVFYPEELSSVKKIIEFFKGIKKEDYDFLIYLAASQWGFWHILRDMIFFRLAGIGCVVGFEIYEGYYNYKKHRQIPVSEVERLKKLIRPLNLTSSKQELEFPVRPEDRCFADGVFNQYGIKEERQKIVVHPGGKKPSKLWPGINFARLVDRLIEEMRGQVILVGSDGEAEIVDEMVKRIKHKVVNLAGKLTLFQLVAVIDRADLMISNDSGPMHIAAAVKTPVVALFSGVDIPNAWYPYGDIHTVIKKDVSCSPCFKSECREHYCMNEITVDEVYRAVKRTLGKEENIS